MDTAGKHRPSIHHKDQFPEWYMHKDTVGEARVSSTIPYATSPSNMGAGKLEEEMDKETFEKLYQFVSAGEDYKESSSIPFATSPALLRSHRR